MKKRKRGLRIKNKSIQIIIALAILIIGIYAIYAQVNEDEAWHPSEQVIVSIDNCNVTLQDAIDYGYLDGTAPATNCLSQLDFPDAYHFANETIVTINIYTLTLEDAIDDGYFDGTGTISASSSSLPSTGHLAEEIKVFVDSVAMSLQEAITNEMLVATCVPGTCVSLGYECGIWDDGCEGTLDCGSCFWNTTIGGIGFDYGRGITTDSSGNIYVTGYTKSFGEGRNDIWTIKYDSNGNQLWNKTLGGDLNDYGYGITTDSSGNIYVVGYTYSFQIFASDIWTIKYDSDGTKIWDRTIGGSNLDAGYGITTDSSGNIYVTGYTYIEADAQGRNIWTIKYDSDGTKIWDKIIGSIGGWTGDTGYGITTDSSGNIYVTGDTYVDGQGRNIWTIKYDSDGTKIWDKTIGGSDVDAGRGITTDSLGNIYVTGYTKSFGAGDYDIWTIKYDSDGTKIWDKTIGGSDVDYGRGITTDSSGNIYVTGYTQSFGEGGDIWAIKYDSDGNQLWNKTIGGSSYDIGYGITADSSGNIYVVGDTRSFGEGGSAIWTIKI